MAFSKGHNPHHPKLGGSIKVEPIRDKAALKRIKKLLVDQPRNLCLFNVGINTAFRASELLSLRVKQVRYLKAGDILDIKQAKIRKYRAVAFNRVCVESVQMWLAANPILTDEDFLFTGQRGVLTVPTVNFLVKTWCKHVGLKGNYGSHSLRKTWGYWQRIERNTAIPLLMEAFGHATQKQTLDYLGIQEDEIRNIYLMEL